MNFNRIRTALAILSASAIFATLADSRSFLQLFQIQTQDELSSLNLPAATDLRTVSIALDKDNDTPFRLHASNPADIKLNIRSNQIVNGDGSLQSSSPSEGTVTNFPDTTIDFSTSAIVGGTVELNGNAFVLPAGTTGQFYRLVFVYVSAPNKIDSNLSTGQVALVNLPNPGGLFNVLVGNPVGYIDLENVSGTTYKTAGSSTTVIENAVGGTSRLVRFDAANSRVVERLSNLSDVDLDTASPSVGETLVYNGNNFVPGAAAAGGGSSSEENIIPNPSAEDPLNADNWTSVGQTLAVTSSVGEVAFGAQSFSWDASATAQSVTSAATNIPLGLNNVLCVAELYYKGGDANLTFRIIQNSVTVKDIVLSAQTNFARVFHEFPCEGDVNGQIAIISTGDAAEIFFDKVHYGTKKIGSGFAGGWKIYDENDVTFSATPTGLVINQFFAQPYKDPFTDSWRIRFNLDATADSLTAHDLVLDGISAPNGRFQACTIYAGSDSNAQMDGAIDKFIIRHVTATTIIRISCDIQLDAKPTWADADGSVNLINDDTVTATLKERIDGHSSTAINTSTPITLKYLNVIKGSNYNISTGEFTAPSDGEYFFTALFTTSGVRNVERRWIVDSTVEKLINGTSTTTAHNASFTFDLTEGQTVKLDIVNLGANANIGGGTNQNIFTIKRNSDFTGGSAVGFALADSENDGLVKKNKWQLKTFSGTATSATDLITFNSLVVGQLYRLTAQIRGNAAGLNRGRIRENGNIIGYMEAQEAGGEGHTSSIFVATGNVATVDWLSGTLSGGGTPDQTFAILEELNNYEDETTEFN